MAPGSGSGPAPLEFGLKSVRRRACAPQVHLGSLRQLMLPRPGVSPRAAMPTTLIREIEAVTGVVAIARPRWNSRPATE